MSDHEELRQAVAHEIGDCFAVALSGNRMPHMSGNPRARLLPHQLHEFDACAANAADAAIAAYEAHRPRADRVAELKAALREIVERWETPLWKDVEPTGHIIARARKVLEGE